MLTFSPTVLRIGAPPKALLYNKLHNVYCRYHHNFYNNFHDVYCRYLVYHNLTRNFYHNFHNVYHNFHNVYHNLIATATSDSLVPRVRGNLF